MHTCQSHIAIIISIYRYLFMPIVSDSYLFFLAIYKQGASGEAPIPGVFQIPKLAF